MRHYTGGTQGGKKKKKTTPVFCIEPNSDFLKDFCRHGQVSFSSTNYIKKHLSKAFYNVAMLFFQEKVTNI